MSNQPKGDRDVYEKGYRTGRDSERILQEDSHVTRERNSAASGLTMGIALALIAALAGGAAYFFSQRPESTKPSAPATQIIPVPVPNNNNSQPQAPTPKKETTIIERTIEKTRDVVPVPVPSPSSAPAPAPSPQSSSKQESPSQPNININIPPVQPQPTEDKASPSPAPAQSQTDSGKKESSNSSQ